MRESEAAITVGEFSRLTHLPIKTLHHYHDVGVLVPVLVDPTNGYRRYAAEQVQVAHLARRLREVRMPLEEMRAVLAAPDTPTRDAGIAAYLDRLQRELTETAAAVAALRTLLTHTELTGAISHRDLVAQWAVALFADVQREQIGPWCAQVYPRLMQSLGRLSAVPTGPGGALYGPGWFEDGGGRVTAFVPIEAPIKAPIEARIEASIENPRGTPIETSRVALRGTAIEAPGGLVPTRGVPDRIHLTTIPAARLAVALHAGSYADLDLTYGVLGRHVLDRGIGAEGPIREYYLVSPGDTDDEAAIRTEVCWPITGPEQGSTP